MHRVRSIGPFTILRKEVVMDMLSRLISFFQAPPLMTIAISRNPGHLTHQECNDGAVTLAHGHYRTGSVTCTRCGAHAEFEPIYAQLFRFTKEDGKERKFPIVRYRNAPKKGRILLISPPSPH